MSVRPPLPARRVPPAPLAKPPLPSRKPTDPLNPLKQQMLVQRTPPPPPRYSTSPEVPPPIAPKPRRPPSTLPKRDNSLQSDLTSAPVTGPPPIPWHTRPNVAIILEEPLKEAPRREHIFSEHSAELSQSTTGCLKCRDFSLPDAHAALYPRESLPPTEASLQWLAQELTSPFPSDTDKARALFTWMHHNIAYDAVAFLSGNVQPAIPASTLASGLAVCGGYSGLYAKLAHYAGLGCITIDGHGKGYGFTFDPAAPLPPFSVGHAWNAVQIDGGEWKLIDSTWGSGALSGTPPVYTPGFNSAWFTMDNFEFGLRHFPSSFPDMLFLDGIVDEQGVQRLASSWEEYIGTDERGGREPTPRMFGRVQEDHGVSETSFLPATRAISAAAYAGSSIRFQFQTDCLHLDASSRLDGKLPYMFVIATDVETPSRCDYVPLENNGFYWWTDIEVAKLGSVIRCYAVTTMNGVDARGVTIDEYRLKKGKIGMAFGGVAEWELV